jgi:glycosyltransferase involved in cell wall biosynthesis
VVSTHVGAEGLDFESGKSILLENSPEGFAQAIIKVLEDQELAQTLGEAAFSIFENLYDREKIVKHLTQSMRQAVFQVKAEST